MQCSHPFPVYYATALWLEFGWLLVSNRRKINLGLRIRTTAGLWRWKSAGYLKPINPDMDSLVTFKEKNRQYLIHLFCTCWLLSVVCSSRKLLEVGMSTKAVEDPEDRHSPTDRLCKWHTQFNIRYFGSCHWMSALTTAGLSKGQTCQILLPLSVYPSFHIIS